MSRPNSLLHTASLDYLTPSESCRPQRRVGSCFVPPESSTGPDLFPHNPNCIARFRDLFSLLGLSPSPSPGLLGSLVEPLQDGSFPSANRLWACLSLKDRKAFLGPSLL